MKYQADVKKWVKTLGGIFSRSTNSPDVSDLDIHTAADVPSRNKKRVRQWLAAAAVTVVAGAGIAFAAGEPYGVSQRFIPDANALDSAPLNTKRLEITVFNTSPGSLGALNISDLLDAGMQVAAVPNVANDPNCGSAVIGGSGQNITITGGNLNNGQCKFYIDVTASTAGSLNATIASGSPLAGTTTVPAAAVATLSVSTQTYTPPTVTNTFSPTTIYPNANTTGSTLISNGNAAALSGGSVDIPLPAGATLVGTPTITGCPVPPASVSVSGGVIHATGLDVAGSAGGSPGTCRINYVMTSSTVGASYNVSTAAGAFTALGGAVTNANTSTSTFNVVARPTQSVGKAFQNHPAGTSGVWVIGQTPKITLTLYNQTDDDWTNVRVTDVMPAHLEVVTPVAVGGTCASTVVEAESTGSVSFRVPALASQSSCTITFDSRVANDVTGTVTITNEIAANSMTRDLNGVTGPVNNNPISATINAAPPVPNGLGIDTVSKSVTTANGTALGNTGLYDAIAGGRVRMRVTIAKTYPDNQNLPLSGVKISDDWSTSAPHLQFNTLGVLPASEIAANSCGPGAVFTAVNAHELVVSNIDLIAVGNCTVDWYVNVDPTVNPPNPVTGLQESNQALGCVDSSNNPTSTCENVSGGKVSNQVTVEIFGPQALKVTKLVNNGPTLTTPVNNEFSYTINVQNNNALPAVNAQIVDTLPAGVAFVSPLNVTNNTCTTGDAGTGPTVSGQTLTWTIAQINGFNTTTGAVSNCSLTFKVVSSPSAVVSTPYTNTIPVGGATVPGQPERTNTSPTEAVVTFTEPPQGLKLTKAFSNAVVFKENGNSTLDNNLFGTNIGEDSFLELDLSNTSTTTNFTNAKFTDNLPAGVSVWTPATPNTTGTTCAGATIDTSVAGKVSVTVPSLLSTSSCKIRVQVIGTAVGTHVNTIPANSVTTDQGATNLQPTSKELNVVSTTPSLTLYKDVTASGGSASIHGTAVNPSDEIEYKFELRNSNFMPVTLSDYGQLVQDALPTGVTPVAGSATEGGVISGQNVSWDFSGRTDITLAPGAKFSFSVKVTVDITATGTLANVARLSSKKDGSGVTTSDCGTSYADTNCLTNPRSTSGSMPANPLALTPAEITNPAILNPAAVSVTPTAHVLVKDVFKTDANGNATGASINGADVVAGDKLTYQITLKNDGAGRLSVKDFVRTITDTLPVGVTFVSADNGGTASGQTVTWDLTSSTDVLAPKGQSGDSKVFTVNVTVDNAAKGSLINIAKTPTKDSNPVNNQVTTVDHSIVKKVYKTSDTSMTSIDTQTVAAGDLLTYELKITNNGDGNLSLKSGVQKVVDTLPAGLTYVTSSDNGSAAGQVVTWDFTTLVTDIVLAKGESKSVTVDVKVADNASGTLKNNATTASGKTSNDVNNPVSAPKHVLLKDVRKKGTTDSFVGGDVIGGDELTYVVTLKNAGTGNLSLKDYVKQVTDAVPVGTTVTSIGSGGSNVGGVITWDLASDTQVLSPGASREFTFDVRVDESATLPITNVAKTKDVSSCPINDTTCINNPPVPECTMPANVLSVTDVEKADPKVCKPVVNNLILDTTLFIEKTVDRKQAELGDMVKYTIRVKNAGKARATAVKVSDTLPLGFRYIENTTRKSDGTAMAEPLGAPGPGLTFDLGNIAAGAELTFTYRVRIGVGAMEGDGTNRAKACTTANKILCSNEGRAKVVVQGGVFTDKACIAGMAYADVNGNSMKDSDEKGVPGVRLYMEDGTNFTTDATGKYSYCGIEPRTHVLKVDKASLPRGSELLITSNRNMGDANSLFLDVKNGELHRGDVAIKPKNEQFMKELELRIKGIYDDASTAGVTFDSAPK